MQQDNKYVIIFTVVMTVLSSLAITGSFVGFNPFHDANESVFIKKEILKSVENILPKKINEYSDEEIASLFEKNIKFISLNLSYSTYMDVNQLIAIDLATIATFENERRKERQI